MQALQQADDSLSSQHMASSNAAASLQLPRSAQQDAAGLPDFLMRTLGELDALDPMHVGETALSPEEDLAPELYSPLDALWAAHAGGADLDTLMPVSTPFALGTVSLTYVSLKFEV